MKKLKVGDICILDQDNKTSLKSYHPSLVKIVGLAGFRKFKVIDVSETEVPYYYKRYKTPYNELIVHANRLTKTDKHDKIIIRFPAIPSINHNDIALLHDLIGKMKTNPDLFTKQEIDSMYSLYSKIKIYYNMRRE